MQHTLFRSLATLVLGIAGVVSVVPATAQTPPCGTVITQSIRLDADMICPLTQPALIVGADNVRIELNGYIIRASTPWNPWFFYLHPPAIHAYGRNRVEVVGPGELNGFLYNVEIVGGRNHVISGVTGTSATALRGASDARIEGNVFGSGVAIVDNLGPPTYATALAVRNQVVNNRLGTTALRGGYVTLRGCLTTKNSVTGNEIFGPVSMETGAYGNLVASNRIAIYTGYSGVAVLLGEAVHNEVRENVIDADGEIGISIQPQDRSECNPGQPGQAGRNGDENRIQSNIIRNGTTGIHVGAIPPLGRTLGTGNVILGNTIVDMRVRGIHFGAGTANNDGRKNKHVNVPVEVEDFGTGNLWP